MWWWSPSHLQSQPASAFIAVLRNGAFVIRGSGREKLAPWCFLQGYEAEEESKSYQGINPKYVHISSLCLLAAADVLLSIREV